MGQIFRSKYLVFILVGLLVLTGCSLDEDLVSSLEGDGAPESQLELSRDELEVVQEEEAGGLDEDGSYSSPEEVALYIGTYGRLPGNFISKAEARELGWDPRAGNLWEIADGKSIGGDRFGNYEARLPKAKGRYYYECDVNYAGGRRGSERLVYSNDGLIYYSADHYESFSLLYGQD